jgi:tetratricopeptide (TPR) repeat protein
VILGAVSAADEGMDDPKLVAEGELSLARLALDDDELPHAADHLANALAVAPTLPEAHALLALLAGHPDGGPELWSLDGEVYVGAAVARAHALAYERRYADGLGLLLSAQGHEPATAWADVAWVVDPELPARIDPDDLVQALAQLIGIVPEPCPDDLRPAFAPYLRLVRHAVAAHAGSAAVLWIASIAVRRFGLHDEAIELAGRSERLEPTDRAAIALGYALRAEGRTDEALAALERALSYQPGNVAVHADIAGMLGAAGRCDEGIGWADRALAIDPSHDCSLIERHALRYQRDGTTEDLIAIADLLRAAEPDSHEARHADGELADRSRQGWLGGIPAATESAIDVLAQFLDGGGSSAGGTLTVSSLEPPSAFLAFDRALPGFELTVSEILPPDPRRPAVAEGSPFGSAGHVAWVYDGTSARPGFGAPSEPAAGAVARLAESSWPHIPAAYDRAVLLADTGLTDLLGVLVHPPASPSGEGAATPAWIRAVQTWACLGIAHHRADEPWPESTRRRVLTDLAFGPEDWITESALFALTATGWVDPATRPDVAELVGWRFLAAVEAGNQRPVTILGSLATITAITPGIDASIAGLARRVLSPAEDPPDPPKRRRLFRRR